MLSPLPTDAGATLAWKRRGWLASAHELHSGAEIVARITPRGLLGMAATAETADDRWALEAAGFWRSRLVIRHGDSDSEDASLARRLSGAGEIRLRDGRVFEWRRENFWGTRWVMRDPAGVPVFRLRRPFGPFSEGAEVTLGPGVGRDPALVVLLLLGRFCLMVDRRRRSAAS